jgi:hypothetical protein
MDSSSSSEHPIEQARREYEDGYRAYLGRTHYLMKDLREQAEPVVEDEQPEERPEPLPGESGAADVFMDLHERATSDADLAEQPTREEWLEDQADQEYLD